MLNDLKKSVYEANVSLEKFKLVTLTWGNVSGIDREKNIMAIKPSGVPYEELQAEDIVLMNLEGEVVEGELRPSSDAATHLELYKSFPYIKGIVHTHSTWAVSFSQAGQSIPIAGTTHADHFYDDVPVTRQMEPDEMMQNYEKNTGKVIVETFKTNNIDPGNIPGVLVNDHGPFTWGSSPRDAVENAVVLEEIAKMAHLTIQLDKTNLKINHALRDTHFWRKHGKNAYYGQTNN